jgi:glutathione S-transferase
MPITFYSAPRSSASPVAFALAELGIEHETITIDFKGDAHKQPEFLKLNPMGQVPTLVDEGQAMFESSAIIIHLGEKYGVERGLWPQVGSHEHMQALTWITWSAVTLGATIRQFFMNKGDWVPEDERNARQVEKAAEQYDKLMKILDSRLDGRSYMLGDEFSLADCHVSAVVAWASGLLGFDLGKTPNVAGWVGRCMARDGAKAMG